MIHMIYLFRLENQEEYSMKVEEKNPKENNIDKSMELDEQPPPPFPTIL